MAEVNVGIRSIADQRYYHFVLMRDSGEFTLPAYWKRVGDIVEPKRSAEFSGERFNLQHRKLRSSKAFARGAVSEALSEGGRGRAPFFYDLFAGKVDLRGTSYFLLGFPFIGLATDIVGDIANAKGLKSIEFIGVDVPKLVEVMERGAEARFEEVSTRIVTLQFVVTDDKSLSAVRLGGDDPLSAGVYVNFLRERVLSGFVRPDVCVLACEKEWQPSRKDASAERQTFRSRLRVDEHGNFRFYAHVDCRNLRLMPYAIGQLRAFGCLRRVPTNPLTRIDEEE